MRLSVVGGRPRKLASTQKEEEGENFLPLLERNAPTSLQQKVQDSCLKIKGKTSPKGNNS